MEYTCTSPVVTNDWYLHVIKFTPLSAVYGIRNYLRREGGGTLRGCSPLRLTGTSPHLLGAKGVNASPQPRTTSPPVSQLQLPLRPTPACPAPAWLWGEIALGCLGWFPGGLGDRPTPAFLEPDWLITLGCLGGFQGITLLQPALA